MKKKLSIIIPVFNEEENIIPLYNELVYVLNPIFIFELVFVNDFSNDNSKKIINNLKRSDQRIMIINNAQNFGQSYSIHKGILKSNYDNIITIDGDCQNDPRDIEKLANIYFSKKLDLVGGIRINRKDSNLKIISSKIANFVRSKLLKDNCADTGCALKIMNKKSFLKIKFFKGYHRFFPALFLKYGFKTDFTYVNHRYRNKGQSKYGTLGRLFEGLRDLIRVMNI